MRRRHGGQHAFSPNLSAARSASPSTNKSINGKVCTRRMILEHVWGPGYEKQLHYLKVYAYRIRRKLSDENGQFLQSDPAADYRLAAPGN